MATQFGTHVEDDVLVRAEHLHGGDAVRGIDTQLLLDELGLKAGQIRERFPRPRFGKGDRRGDFRGHAYDPA